MLGGIEGCFSTGELWRLWDWGLEQGYQCGCGLPIRDCPKWQEILTTAFDRELDPKEMLRIRNEVLSWKNAPRLLRRARGYRDHWPALDKYVLSQRRLYDAVASVTESNIVVDSSKWPIEPAVLGLIPGIRVLVVHLVRDPRAVAYSWSRKKSYLDRPESTMDRFGIVHSATSWLLRNATLELARLRTPVAWIRLRYEDLVEAPRAAVALLARHEPLLDSSMPFLGENTTCFEGHHMIGGNPSKATSGSQRLQPDREWLNKMPAYQQTIVAGLTLPLLLPYGYPIRNRPQGRNGQ